MNWDTQLIIVKVGAGTVTAVHVSKKYSDIFAYFISKLLFYILYLYE